jgi:DNA-binding response OmpR family regulator
MATPSQPDFSSRRLLLVEDDQMVARALSRLLRYEGFEVRVLHDSREAMKLFQQAECPCEFLVTDLNLPWASGLDLVREIRLQWPQLPVVVFAGAPTLQDRQDLLDLGVKAVLQKPASAVDIMRALQRNES